MTDPMEIQVARLSAQVQAGFEGVKARLDHSAGVMERIEEQVTRTNGRVTELERDRAIMKAIAAHDRELRDSPESQVLTIAWVGYLIKYGGWIVAAAGAWWSVAHR